MSCINAIYFNSICKRLLQGDKELQLIFAKARLLRILFDWNERQKICFSNRKKLANYVFSLTPIVEEQSYDLMLQWIEANDIGGKLENVSISASIFKEEKLRKLLGFFLLRVKKEELDYLQLLKDCVFIEECIGISLLPVDDDFLPF